MIFDDRGIVGFDVSHYQSYYDRERDTWTYIDWELMKQSGIYFVVCKAGQNDFYDPTFSYNWFQAKKVGIPRASYWFLDYRSSPKSQAQRYWELLKSDPGEGPLIVDFEQGSSGFWDDVYAFIAELQRLSGYPDHKIWIYTGYYYWIDAFKFGDEANQLWFGKYPLWLAWYSADEYDVIIPPPWKKCVLWQQGTPPIGKSVGAQSKEIDYNVFNGDDLSLSYYFDGVDPHVIEEPMYFKALTTINIRSSAGVLTTNDLGDFNLMAGDIVEVDDPPFIVNSVNKWRRIRSIWRADQPVAFAPSPSGEYWCAESIGTTIYLTSTTFTPPTPAKHVVEVFVDGNSVFRQELS